MRINVSGDAQYTHAWLQPRYGLIVQPNGRAFAEPGTWFSALLARTSWKVIPANSGVCTERTSELSLTRPGSASPCSTSISCPLHLIASLEHMFECSSSRPAGRRSPVASNRGREADRALRRRRRVAALAQRERGRE